MIGIVILETNRSNYDIRDAARSSMTVGELIRELEGYDEDERVVFSNDNGYTYGYISSNSVDRQRVETREEEERREEMEQLRDELDDLKYEFENPDEDEEPMTEAEYEEGRQKLFKEYGTTEEEYNNFRF